MKKSLYYWLPSWIFASLKDKICSKCQNDFRKKDISAVGIRNKGQNKAMLYVEHKCSQCGHRAASSFGNTEEDSVEQLCYMLLEEIKKKKILEKSQHNKNSLGGPITDEEMNDFHKFVQDTKTHEEFMKGIGGCIPGDKDHQEPKE